MRIPNMEIPEMSKDQLIAIDPDDINWELSKIEMFSLLKELGGFWEYDYGALEGGKPGYHAELRSGLHSDSFMDFGVVLQHKNLRKIIAKQLVNKYKSSIRVISNLDWINPTCVAGIPNGATLLGEDVADILEARKIKLVKQDEEMKMNSILEPTDNIILVEDVFTKGNASKKAVATIAKYGGSGRTLPFVLAIVNRGGLSKIKVDSGFLFDIISLHSVNFNEWDEDDCELCRMGSKIIKSDEIRKANLAMR